MSRLGRLGSNLSHSSIVGTRDDEIAATGGALFALGLYLSPVPNPQSSGNNVVMTVSVVLTGNQTNLVLQLQISSGFDGGKPTTPTDTSITGWTNASGWTASGTETNPVYNATFTSATRSEGVNTLTITFGVTGSGTVSVSGTVSSDQVGDPAIANDTVTVT